MAGPESKPETSETLSVESGLAWFTPEAADERKTLRWAWILAVAFHGLLLVVQFPEVAATEPPPPEEKKVYVVQQVRFKEPPPPKTPELPKVEPKPIPYPDPTPDEPEPIRELQDLRPEIELPEDLIVEIPEGPPPSPPDRPIPVGGDVTAPVKIYHPQPGYTEMARRARIEGFVIVQAIVDRQGDVVDAKILKSLPMGLDQEALQAIRRWKFEPATLNGKPVDVYYNLTVSFQLQ